MSQHLHNPDLEKATLAALVNARTSLILDTAAPAATFASVATRALYEAIKGAAAKAQGEIVTDFMIEAEVRKTGQLQACGGEYGLRSLFEMTKPCPSVHDAFRRLRDLSRNRLVNDALLQAQSSVKDGRTDDALETLQAVFGATDGTSDGINVHTTADLIEAATLHYMQNAEERKVTIPIISGAIGDLPPGALLTIGGDTNAGKSSLALYIAEQYYKAGVVPGIVSLEDPAPIWGDRIQAMHSGVSMSAVQRGEVDRNGHERIQRTATKLRDHKAVWVMLDHYERATVCAGMRKAVSQGAQLLVVDYMQQIDCSDMRGEPERVRMSAAAKALKREAKRLGVPLILASQLTRPTDKTGKRKEPTKNTLKGSGDLENMSEFVILLWQETDETDAPTIGKVAKAKTSPKRPRFQLVRNKGGAIVSIVPHTVQEQHTRNGYSGSYGGGRYADR